MSIAMNFVTFRIFSIAIKRTPSETSRTYKEMIEQKDIEHDNRRSAYPPCPTGIALQKRRRTPSTTRSRHAEGVFFLAMALFFCEEAVRLVDI